MRVRTLLQSFTFRLALVYVGLFSLSVILLFLFIFSFATRYVEQQTIDSIENRFARIQEEYRNNGSEGVERLITNLVKSDEEGSEIYILLNKENERIAGNLEAWPKYGVTEAKYKNDGEWIHFSIEGTRNYPEPIGVKALTYSLSKWRHVLVGQSLLAQQKMKQIILQTLLASLLVTVAMAFIGALVITRSVGKRVHVINKSAYSIMHGNLSARIPRTYVNDAFDTLSANLNDMLDKIETLLKSLSDFSHNIAHDLRTPLGRIVARTEAGLRGLKEGSAARRLLEKNVDEMEGLIATFNSILKISELEANADIQSFAPCNVSELMEHLVEFYEPLASEKNLTLKASIAADISLNAEPNLLSQALANLIDNAIKFSPTHGTVEVGATQELNRVLLWVADSGAGIPESYRDKVFEKFFRMEESRSAAGNGLGLSLVAAVARIHRAQIVLSDNAPGLRAEIIFALSIV
jgi:signal transduction histidine kinase